MNCKRASGCAGEIRVLYGTKQPGPSSPQRRPGGKHLFQIWKHTGCRDHRLAEWQRTCGNADPVRNWF